MVPDPARVADTQAWLAKAANDLRAADIDLAAIPPLLDDATFHCQQAVEKALKAFLTWHDRPFRRTHDLVEIGDQCVAIDPLLDALLRRAAPLTQYAWVFRYPGNEPPPSRDEADEALSLAREVVAVVRDRIPVALQP
jgi:HEPN domain-containing protein